MFFLLSAPLTWRAFGHTALLSHWLVLAALDSYFRDPGSRPVRWLARLWVVQALAAGITPYVAAMCFLLTLTGIARLWLERRCRWPLAGVLAVLSLGILYTTLLSFGVLAARGSSSYWAPGYGMFSLNLNSLINPMDTGPSCCQPFRSFTPRRSRVTTTWDWGSLSSLS